MISVKKLATVGAAGGLLLASAMPVFASHWDIKVEQSNKGKVENNVTTQANTGDNGNFAEDDVKYSDITTGDASATSDVRTKLNKNFAKVDNCECEDDVKVKQENKWGSVKNNVTTQANTGLNANVAGDDVKNSNITTGNATATSTVKSKVNKNVAIVN